MRSHWMQKGLKFAIFGALAVAVFGFAVMTLWNWLMPTIFGSRLISFWQALGLLVLSKMLFGGFRGGPARHWSWRRRMMERWERMTPEERVKFREGVRGCGHFGGSIPPPDAPPLGAEPKPAGRG